MSDKTRAVLDLVQSEEANIAKAASKEAVAHMQSGNWAEANKAFEESVVATKNAINLKEVIRTAQK